MKEVIAMEKSSSTCRMSVGGDTRTPELSPACRILKSFENQFVEAKESITTSHYPTFYL